MSEQETGFNGLHWLLSNFSLSMFIVSTIFILVNRVVTQGISTAEMTYRWTAFFALGFTSLYAFVMHAFFQKVAASSIGWQPSPFEFEVAMANLAIGTIAVLSFKASYGFRLATVIAATVLLWGAASGHIYQMVKFQNFSVGNAGSWFWMDVIIPLVLSSSLLKIKR